MKILSILAITLLPLSGCTVGLKADQTAVSSITLPKCPPGTTGSIDVMGGGGFGAGLTFAAKLTCNGGAPGP